MGYIQAFSPCAVCHVPFFYSPTRVPSVRVDGVRQPICENCVARANIERQAAGLSPIVPLPGAYEADEESEVWGDDN